MGKILHNLLIIILLNCAAHRANAQQVNSIPGFYQHIDLSPDSKCACNNKSDRYYDLYKGVVPADMSGFQMFAYKIKLDNQKTSSAAKLFHAFEQDTAIHKVSVREWDYMLLFVGPGFNKNSFDQAATTVFAEFSEITPEEFFLHKNANLLNQYKLLFPGAH